MSPQKPISMLIDESIERDIDWQIEQEHSGGTTVEAEQMEFEEQE